MGQAFLMGQSGGGSLSSKMIKNSYDATCYASENIEANVFVNTLKGSSGYGRTMGSTLTGPVGAAMPYSTYPFVFQLSQNKYIAFNANGTSVYAYVCTGTLNSFGVTTAMSCASSALKGVNMSYTLFKVFRFSTTQFVVVARDTNNYKYYVCLATLSSDFTSCTFGNKVNYSFATGSGTLRFCKLTDSRFVLVSSNNATSSSYDFWARAVIDISGNNLSIYGTNNATGTDNYAAATNFCVARASDTSYWVSCDGYGSVLFTINENINETTLKSNKKGNAFSDYVTIDGEMYGFTYSVYNGQITRYKVTSTTVTALASLQLPRFLSPGSTSNYVYASFFGYDSEHGNFLAFYQYNLSSTYLSTVASIPAKELLVNGSTDFSMYEVQQFNDLGNVPNGYIEMYTENKLARVQKFGDCYYVAYNKHNYYIYSLSFTLVPIVYQTINSASSVGITTKAISANTQGEIIASCKM